MSIRVIVADDHPVVRDGLCFSLERAGGEIEVVGQAADGVEALALAKRTRADVFIFDITMPRMNGLEATRALMEKRPRARVIILSIHDTREIVEEALRVGVRGYLSKETASRDVVEAIRQVHAGRIYLSPGMARMLAETTVARGLRHRRDRNAGVLTAQERKVTQLTAEGLSAKEIAVRLGRSVHTVRAHKKNLMAKLGFHKQADLVRFAVREGIAKL